VATGLMVIQTSGDESLDGASGGIKLSGHGKSPHRPANSARLNPRALWLGRQ
jgi:hypothetical protein